MIVLQVVLQANVPDTLDETIVSTHTAYETTHQSGLLTDTDIDEEIAAVKINPAGLKKLVLTVRRHTYRIADITRRSTFPVAG